MRRLLRSRSEPGAWCCDTLELASWSPGFSRSSEPAKAGTPTRQRDCDGPLVTILLNYWRGCGAVVNLCNFRSVFAAAIGKASSGAGWRDDEESACCAAVAEVSWQIRRRTPIPLLAFGRNGPHDYSTAFSRR